MHKKGLHSVAFLLLIVGGVNWLLVGLFNWDIGALFGGMDAMVSKAIYILVGLSALYELATHGKNCKCCGGCGDCATCHMEGEKNMDAPKM